MKAKHATLEDSVLLLTGLLEAAYTAHVRRTIALRQGRTSRVDDYDLRRLLDEIVPDVLRENVGVDGQITWLLGVLKLHEERAVVEASVLREIADGQEVFHGAAFWRRFRARLTLSVAGLEWGELERCRRRSAS